MNFFIAFLRWCLLLLLCWPLALLLVVLFPIVWLLCLPFRLGFWALEGVFGIVRGLLRLPGRLLGGGRESGR